MVPRVIAAEVCEGIIQKIPFLGGRYAHVIKWEQ